MKGGSWALVIIVAWLGLMFIPTFWPDSVPGPCAQAATLRQDIERRWRERKIEALERKKDALDDQIYRFQVSPEQYKQYQEKLRALNRDLSPVMAETYALEQKEFDEQIGRLLKADTACKAASSPTLADR